MDIAVVSLHSLRRCDIKHRQHDREHDPAHDNTQADNDHGFRDLHGISQFLFPFGLVKFTDGLQNLCLATADYTPYQPFFAPLFAQIGTPLNRREAEAALVGFLQSERLSKRAEDDKTLVLLGQADDQYGYLHES